MWRLASEASESMSQRRQMTGLVSATSIFMRCNVVAMVAIPSYQLRDTPAMFGRWGYSLGVVTHLPVVPFGIGSSMS